MVALSAVDVQRCLSRLSIFFVLLPSWRPTLPATSCYVLMLGGAAVQAAGTRHLKKESSLLVDNIGAYLLF